MIFSYPYALSFCSVLLILALLCRHRKTSQLTMNAVSACTIRDRHNIGHAMPTLDAMHGPYCLTSLDEAHVHIQELQIQWTLSPCRSRLIGSLDEMRSKGGWPITQAIALATGPLTEIDSSHPSHRPRERIDRSRMQLVIFLFIVDYLQQNIADPTPIQLFAQDPSYSFADVALLERLGMQVLVNPQAQEKVGASTFTYAPFIMLMIEAQLMARCRDEQPALHIAADMDGRWTNRAIARRNGAPDGGPLDPMGLRTIPVLESVYCSRPICDQTDRGHICRSLVDNSVCGLALFRKRIDERPGANDGSCNCAFCTRVANSQTKLLDSLPQMHLEKRPLTVQVTDGHTTMLFKIGRVTQLKRLIDAFCKRQDQVPGRLRLLFEGARVGPTDSAENLQMSDGDMLAVYEESVARACGVHPRSTLDEAS